MDSNQLKFLLKLLGCDNYRTSLTAKGFKDIKDKNSICKKLSDLELVDYSREISAFKILPAGRALLKMDASALPISDNELKVLEKIAKSSTKLKPSQIKIVKATERDAILQSFADRGLIEADTQMKKTKAEVWLTQRGKDYLRDEYIPKGNANVSLELLGNYVRFLRKSPRLDQAQPTTQAVSTLTTKATDEQILQIIQDLDKNLGTENYLPIFHLRQKLQPPFSREELDQVLYRLQRSDKIDLSTLVDPTPYTPEQIDAGIPKDTGGYLFFLMVN
ncbi:MAG: hypothetical protein WBB28_14955 [Crinalium sp.]